MPATVPAPGERIAWLDGLRALAVLLVVYAHLSRYLFRGARDFSSEWLHAGTAGVMLFFLVSGFIIPASLERHGSLRAFWVSRLFRLLPLYLVVTAVVVVLGLGGLVPLDPWLTAHPWTSAVAHATMLPHLLGVPLVTPVFWTLTFEMVFYLLVSALFAVRWHRRGGAVAVILAVLTVCTVPLAPTLIPTGTATVVAAVSLLIGLVAVTSGHRWAVVPGGLLLAALAGTLLVADQDPAHVWDGLLIVAVMFVGTTLYRAQQRQLRWWAALTVAATVAAALLFTWYAELDALGAPTARYRTRSVITLVVFGGAFALALLTRHRRTPRALAWLGVVSYSVYLVHFVLIQLLAPVLTGLGNRLPAIAEVPVAVAFLALLLSLSWLTHRFVELPGQRLGRRLARWLTARRGSDALISDPRPRSPVPAGVPPPTGRP
ncbi:acyltransferase family protein [Actinoplanes friuliensis]|uniref:Acyltransferase n=1 Tax=Actinoplanes friuliensis DSM 7358 TaxID=1246995 RepID=U5VXP5_9ACTN|nr:acyltransferase [Actinoplanes friuliensis]AGZ41753.1 acyltransferase [Actinoplanes friuliensis DSM 7358]